MSTNTNLVAALPGDGIGPEVIASAVQVCERAAERFEIDLQFETAPVGGAAIDETGSPLPDETRALCQRSRAVLLGAIGGPKWDDPNAEVRPEEALLELRGSFGLFANLRPIRPVGRSAANSPIRGELLENVDILFVRELTGGIYFGAKHRTEREASDLMVYTVEEIERIVRRACRLAASRSGRLTSVDKANILESSRLWRETTTRIVWDEFPTLELEHLLVDAMAMHLLRRPSDFDVVVTENMFGDILTDEASMLSGSLGMLPSASLGEGVFGLYEPVHGSAPDIAGRGIANPFGAILSSAMMLRESFDRPDAAAAIEHAVELVIERGLLPRDLGPESASTDRITSAVVDALQ